MGWFSRRRSKGFDPELWSDASARSDEAGDEPWFADLANTEDQPTLEDLETKAGASFEPDDEHWLADDPGAEIRDADG